jgi:hypothetical protein
MSSRRLKSKCDGGDASSVMASDELAMSSFHGCQYPCPVPFGRKENIIEEEKGSIAKSKYE